LTRTFAAARKLNPGDWRCCGHYFVEKIAVIGDRSLVERVAYIAELDPAEANKTSLIKLGSGLKIEKTLGPRMAHNFSTMRSFRHWISETPPS
jgi:hypothetical protein